MYFSDTIKLVTIVLVNKYSIVSMTGHIISCYYFTKVELENMEVYVLGIAFFFCPAQL